MNETITQYLQVIQGSKMPKTHVTYTQVMRAFVNCVGDDAPLTVETYIKFLRAIKDMNPSTKALYSSAVIGLYTFYGSFHPEINITALRQANKQYLQRPGIRLPNFDNNAIEIIIGYCELHKEDIIAMRDRAFILTLADTGLRISEACGLRRGDINWEEARTIVIGKGNKQAVVRFSDRSLESIREYLAVRAELDGALGKPLASLPLFARHDKGSGKKIKPVQSHGMWAAVKEVAKSAGVDPSAIRVHDFRHFFVTKVYKNTRDIKATKDLARHADISTTSRYTHLDGELDGIYAKVFNSDR
jgi:integrase/recombinase XerC